MWCAGKERAASRREDGLMSVEQRVASSDAADRHEQAPAVIEASGADDGAAAGHDQAGGRHDIPAPRMPPSGEQN